MKTRMRKSYQRKFNKLIRGMNKAIKDDPLWKGRFMCRQTDTSFMEFEDGSGGTLYPVLRFYDKETGYYWDTTMAYAPYYRSSSVTLFVLMNDFIVNYCEVWEADERPRRETSIDYTNVIVPDSAFYTGRNYFLERSYFNE